MGTVPTDEMEKQMILTKFDGSWNIALTLEEFSCFQLALGNVTNLDEIKDMIGEKSANFLFDLEELVEGKQP